MSKQVSDDLLNDAIIKDIRDTLKGLEFGFVTIKVHQSKIVQIEVTQKKRFDQVWDLEGGGGI